VGPFDAEVLETIFMPTFTKEDLVNLGQFQMYLTLMIDGVGSPPFSAVSIPRIEPPAQTCRAQVIESSRKAFASSRAPIEESIATELKINPDATYEELEPKRKTTTYRKPPGGDSYGTRPRAPRAPQALPMAEAGMMISAPPETSSRGGPEPVRQPDRPPRPQQPRPIERPMPAAGQKSAEDLRAILRRMTEEANKGKTAKVVEKQENIRQSVVQATRPNTPQPPPARAQPAPEPVVQIPPPVQAPQPAAFEVPEADLRNLFKEDI